MGNYRNKSRNLSRRWAYVLKRRSHGKVTKKFIPGMSVDIIYELEIVFSAMRAGSKTTNDQLRKLLNFMEGLLELFEFSGEVVRKPGTKDKSHSPPKTNISLVDRNAVCKYGNDVIPIQPEVAPTVTEPIEDEASRACAVTEPQPIASQDECPTEPIEDEASRACAATEPQPIASQNECPTEPIEDEASRACAATESRPIASQEKCPTSVYWSLGSAAKHVRKPQYNFADKIDNTPKPWRPPIRKKPNFPMLIDSCPTDHEILDHPYERELEKFVVPERQLKKLDRPTQKSYDESFLVVIETPQDIKFLIDDLLQYDEIAVDLFEHYYRSFQGFTCLVQISTRDTDYLIDAMALRSDLHALNQVFANPSILKVFHCADSKILWLQRDLSVYVVNMFDVEKAAKRLNRRSSLRYLTKTLCNLELTEYYRLTDWRIRPLAEELMKYARERTHCLLSIKDDLRDALIDAADGTTNFLRAVYDVSTETCKRTYVKPVWNDDVWKNMYEKSGKTFDNRQLRVLRALHRWRDETARTLDESYGYVLPDHMLLDIAEKLPGDPIGLLECCCPIPALVRKNMCRLRDIVVAARSEPSVREEEDAREGSEEGEETVGAEEYDGDVTKKHAWLYEKDGTEEDGTDASNGDRSAAVNGEDEAAERRTILKRIQTLFFTSFARYHRGIPLVRTAQEQQDESKQEEKIDVNDGEEEIDGMSMPKDKPATEVKEKTPERCTNVGRSNNGDVDRSFESMGSEEIRKQVLPNPIDVRKCEREIVAEESSHSGEFSTCEITTTETFMNVDVCDGYARKPENETPHCSDNRKRATYDSSSDEESDEEISERDFVAKNKTTTNENRTKDERFSEKRLKVIATSQHKLKDLKLANITDLLHDGMAPQKDFALRIGRLQQLTGQPKIRRCFRVYAIPTTAQGQNRVRKEDNASQRSPAQIDRILRPRKQEIDYGGEESDDEIDYVEDQEASETEASCSEGEVDEVEDEIEDEEDEAATVQRRRRKFVCGKDKYKWCLETPETRDIISDLLPLHLPAAKGNSSNASNPYEVWNALFTDEMLERISKWTNTEIERHNIESNANNAQAATFAPLSINELKAFIGLLYYQGVNKNNHLNLTEMWSNEFGSNLYRTVMSQKRFSFIGARLRFDDRSTRAERRTVDALAPIRELWDSFIDNCQKNYTPGENLTIDEQLLGFRGKFSARVYIPSKPARYGIKMLSLNDSETFYMYNAIPYTGKVEPERAESVPTCFVRRLSEPIHDSGRIITCDNWFSSVECFKKMLKSHNLRMVGTLRKNKRQIPESFKHTASTGTMRVGYDGELSLTSYCPKKNKVVLVLSTVHKSVKINEDKLKPETILYYNKNKSGTDVFEQLCGDYSCARKTPRWPLRLFFGIIDQAGVNSCILWNLLAEHEILTRREFLNILVLALVKPFLHDRMNITRLTKATQQNIRVILGTSEIQEGFESNKMAKRKRCAYCEPSKDRKTFLCCSKCRNPACEEHRYEICIDCV